MAGKSLFRLAAVSIACFTDVHRSGRAGYGWGMNKAHTSYLAR